MVICLSGDVCVCTCGDVCGNAFVKGDVRVVMCACGDACVVMCVCGDVCVCARASSCVCFVVCVCWGDVRVSCDLGVLGCASSKCGFILLLMYA